MHGKCTIFIYPWEIFSACPSVEQASRLSIVGVGFIRPVLSLRGSAATAAIPYFLYVIPSSLYACPVKSYFTGVIPEKSGIQNIYCPHLFFVFFSALVPRTITIRYTYTLYAIRYTLICTLHLLYFLSLSFLRSILFLHTNPHL